MTRSENKVGLNSPVLDLHQWFVNRLSPSSHHPFTLLRLWPTTHTHHSCHPACKHPGTAEPTCRNAAGSWGNMWMQGQGVLLLSSAISSAASASLCLSSAPFTIICHFSMQVSLPNFFFNKSRDFLLFSLLQGSSLWLYSIKEPQAYHWPGKNKQLLNTPNLPTWAFTLHFHF